MVEQKVVTSQIKAYLLCLQTHTHTHRHKELAISARVNSDPPWRPGTRGRGSVERVSLSPSLGKDLHSYPSHPPDEPSPIHTASVKRISVHKQNYFDLNSPSPTVTEANIYDFLNNCQKVLRFRKQEHHGHLRLKSNRY